MLVETIDKNKPIEAQRSKGVARVNVQFKNHKTRLVELYQQGCAKIRIPQTFNTNGLECVMINTSGGITGGDLLNWQMTAQANSNLTITSQACERLYKSNGAKANIEVSLTAKSDSTLNWLPQETILFDESATHRKIKVELEGNAKLLMVEPIVFGRAEMGEAITKTSFKDDWRIFHNGNLVHAEAALFDQGHEKLLQNKFVIGDNIAMTTLMMVAGENYAFLESKIEEARSLISNQEGVSFWEVGNKENRVGKLIVRLVAKDSYQMRKTLIPLIKMLKDDAHLPKSWAM